MGYSFTDLGAEGCRRSLNALLSLSYMICMLLGNKDYFIVIVIVIVIEVSS